MNTKRFDLNLILAVAIIMVTGGYAFSASPIGISAEIEKAALAEKWQLVADLCGPNEKLTSSPVLRAIKGHALLALNHNNESLLLFLSISDDSVCMTWRKWTESFSSRYSTNAVAHYLKGDALGRCGNYDRAIKSFAQALKYKPNFALALNARGAIYAYKKQWNEALADFEKACTIAPKFADAHASLGNLLLLKKAPSGAADCFNKVLPLFPEFALALNGRGCANFGEGFWAEATNDFKQACEYDATMKLALFNANALAKAELELASKALGDSAGMSINVKQEIDKLKRDIQHNEKTLQVLPWIPDITLKFGDPKKIGTEFEWSKSAIRDNTLRNLKLQQAKLKELDPFQQFEKTGGATTEELKRALVDKGDWPFINWFGLAYGTH